MATCSSRPKIAGQSNRCCIWPLRHVATMAPSSPLPRHLDLLPTLCIAGSPRCITTPNMSPLEKHLPPAKERLLPTVRMREERLPLYAMQEHLRNASRKGHDAHRRHRCKLSPDVLARYGSANSGIRPPTLCVAGSPMCIATLNMVAKHLPPVKERSLLTVRMREQRLPLSCRRRRVVKLSATPSSPSHAQLRRAAVSSPVAAFDEPQGAAAGTKEGATVELDGFRRADPGSGWPDPATTG